MCENELQNCIRYTIYSHTIQCWVFVQLCALLLEITFDLIVMESPSRKNTIVNHKKHPLVISRQYVTSINNK